jgi:soluble lytic murein transglycosylase-like protein
LNRSAQFVLAVVIAASCATAGAADLAVLRNGNSIRHERREVVGAVTRLYLSDSASGYIEIPTDQIERFEKDTAPPAPKTIASSGSRALPLPAPIASAKPVALSREDLSAVVNGAGERHQIDPDFINSVIRAESGFHQNAVSRKGAQGLMQLMPGTASQLGVSDPFDPHANVEGGTKYLRELLEKYNFDVPKALAAYNAGPNRVDRYRGVPPYYETQAYISRIIRDFNRQKLAENPALANNISSRKTKNSAARSSRTTARQPRTAATSTSVPKGPESASR